MPRGRIQVDFFFVFLAGGGATIYLLDRRATRRSLKVPGAFRASVVI
jgi:hypothetical protein